MSMALGSVHNGSTKKGVKLPHGHPFYFEDAHVVFKVENQIYKVHRHFLVRESEFFQDMFSLPQGDSARVEGFDDDHPICIPNTPTAEFENLLRFFYFGMRNDYSPTVADWIAMLSISTRLIFPRVRERAIKELTSRLEEIDPFDLIGLAIKYDVKRWLMPTYRRIVTRTDLISYAEAEKIPSPVAVMLMRSHEWYSLKKTCDNPGTLYARMILISEVNLMEKSRV